MNVIQYKFPLKSKADFLEKAQTHGIAFSAPIRSEYTYFQIPHAESGGHITLRMKKSDSNAVDLKVKRDGGHEYEYFESEISDPQAMESILSHSGIKPLVTFHKTRQTFKNEFVRIDLDDLKELGPMAEVKFEPGAEERVQQFLTNLGIDVSDADHRSNVEIYMDNFNV
jgi:adenylate cyclase class IV